MADVKRRRLTREAVLRTALAEIDAAGLDACSMRALATRLDVTPRALYRHVADKEDILLGVAELVLADVRLPSTPAGWRQRLRSVALEIRRVLVEHPHTVPLFTSPSTAAPRAVVGITDAAVGALREAGVGSEDAVRSFYAIYNYVIGFALSEAGLRVVTRPGPRPTAVGGIGSGAALFAVDAAPFLLRFASEGMFASGEQYGFGLDLLLDSIARLAGPQSESAKDA